MNLTQQRKDVHDIRIGQLKDSMAGVADRYEEVINRLEKAEERCSDLSSKLIEARVFITGGITSRKSSRAWKGMERG